ncbi:MAG: LysR substrate-binding domain-containing protein [Lacunisphaera sp.]|nr:LysR substrate-binding domain-containing protein [Lacunisphaera sp.]
MELRQLRYFLTTAELLNFTRAAERHRVAQPALSRQIRSLEDELGVRLLERDSRRVALTAAGHLFLQDIREIMEQLEGAEARIKRFHREGRQPLQLGFAPSLVGNRLPAIIQILSDRRPDLQITLHDLTNEDMITGIRDRQLDAALLPAAAVPRSELFTVWPLHTITFAVVFPAGHPLARKKRVQVADLRRENLIAYDRRHYPDYWKLIREIYTQAGLPLMVDAEVDGGGSLLASVQSGQGVAIVSTTLRATAPRTVEFRPLHPSPAARLALLHHRDLPARTMASLRDACQSAAAD